MGTAAQESALGEYIRQLGKRSGLGDFPDGTGDF